ncbi:hypothetical protein AB0I28_25645 [Phytomonospora sp. NPDC050363]|uniref:hypothetical protein n=1 Tax=Phytomonospora sp. NPDC050363 TaxID=3155642 RepID=UPI0033D3263F
MPRADVIKAVTEFAGPRGPFRNDGDLLGDIDVWVAGQGPGLVAALADLVLRPPAEDELCGLLREDFDNGLGELLCTAAGRWPDSGALTPLLIDERSRPYAVDALGCTAEPGALAVLRGLRARNEGEAERITDAIGELRERLGA